MYFASERDAQTFYAGRFGACDTSYFYYLPDISSFFTQYISGVADPLGSGQHCIQYWVDDGGQWYVLTSVMEDDSLHENNPIIGCNKQEEESYAGMYCVYGGTLPTWFFTGA